ncbi:ABC transporter permease [Litorilinea aerophila]|uniref:ABC transporter permease n=1 Tax=Litorilinea aerophila TaxID=1204385 RepID=A0A540VCA6_9CHLR|nr:ABC transporter permease [Litorilinea aerophila]MCC9077776.1 ABC transporter permease [Litorilinea aerophila]OUC07684.1 ABC transporter permease [Litorilinea aerophila]GIV79033.1 MAG: ABC transporter permease [Litorilinea sp.]
MRKFILGYLLPRIGQYFMVIFLGVTLTFIIPRFSPNDPVERQVSQIMMSGSQVSPEAIEHLREALTEMYGLSGSPWQQYWAFWGRLLRGDLGPSLSTFPTPVTKLIADAMPWTLGLLLTAVLISWLLGNLLGGLAGYYTESRIMRAIDVLSQAVRPIPYYIMALVLLAVFAYYIPLFPFSGAYPPGTHVEWSLSFILTVVRHSILPALSLILVGIGGWFIGMRALASNIVSEDYVVYVENAGLPERTIVFNYVIRNALLPQITGLALQLGLIFNGALIMEVVFGYPGMGTLTLQAVMANDYTLIMGITIFSIIGVATSVLILDLIYPLFDPRVRHQ